MPSHSGRTTPDIKAQVSLGNQSFTQRFSITGVLTTEVMIPKLFSPLPLIQELPHGQLTSASKVKIASTSALDNIGGIGARVIVVGGLSPSFLLQEEIILLNGQTPVETTLDYIRVLELTILVLGTNADIDTGDLVGVGDIYCGTGTFTAGIPTSPIVGIKASVNNLNSREAIFTVPDGKFMLIRSVFCTTTPDKKENNNIEVELGFHIFGTGTNQWYKSVPYNFDSTYHFTLESLLLAPPKTDIQVRGRTTFLKEKEATVEIAVEMIDASRISF